MAIKELQAYELLREEGLSDIQSVGYLLRHRKSGARIMVIANDDDNKVFHITFRTPPVDSTGVAHILEHCSLCGSEKFPYPYNPASVCHAWYHHRSDSGDRTYCWRISSPALYGRKRLSAPESGRMAFQDPAAGRNFDDPAVS